MSEGTYVHGDLAMLEAGFAALEQAVLVHDKEGRIVACNPAAARLAGKPVDEILGARSGSHAHTAHYKDGTPVTLENSRLMRCIRTGEPERKVLVELRDEDRSRWVEVSHQPLTREGERDPWGAVTSITPIPSDPTPYETLSDFSRQLQGMLGAPHALLAVKDLEGRYLFINRTLAEALGVSRDDATGHTDHEVLPREAADASVEFDRQALESSVAVGVEERLGSGDAARTLRTIRFPLLDDAGRPYALARLSADVTGLDRDRRELRAQLDAAPVALLIVDADGRVAFANRRAHAIAARCDDLALAIEERERLADLAGESAGDAAAGNGESLSLTRLFEQPDGAELWLELQIASLGEGRGAICSLRDITEEREHEQELSHQAFHDSLTGLPNRRFTEQQLALGLARARRHQGGLGVVFLDIDGFKRVNDELGHAAGDDVLTEFAARLGGAVRESDAVGRLADPGSVVARRGGDEFVLVLTDLPADCRELVSTAMARVEQALREPFQVAGRELDVAASMGAAVYPDDSEDPRELLDVANAKMREVKRRRRRAAPG